MSAEKLSLGQQILEGLGGAGNIKVFENCMTRLRVVVVDPSKVDRAALGNIKGVLRVVSTVRVAMICSNSSSSAI